MKSLNLRSECLLPSAFIGFRGGNGQAVVTNNTETFSLSFGEKSKSDLSTEVLFKDYCAKFASEENAESYFQMLSKYQESVEDLMNEIVWEDVLEDIESDEEYSAQS